MGTCKPQTANQLNRAFLEHQIAKATRTFFDEFCANPSLWDERSCRRFIMYARTSPHSFMTEQEKLRLLESGLDDHDLEELRVVFKWAKLFTASNDFWD